MVEIAARQTTMIKASITAYSTAVGPSSDTMNFFTLFANFNISIIPMEIKGKWQQDPSIPPGFRPGN
jgi:hypothetical protein